ARQCAPLIPERERKSDVDRHVDAILVFDFRFGQRAMAIETPIDGLQSAVQIPALEDLAERTNFVGFALELHRRVRMIPIAEHTQPLKLRSLARDLFSRVRTAKALR